MITKDELARGIRFAGARAAAAASYTKNWDHQLAHQWTSRDAFVHIATSAGTAPQIAPLLAGGALAGVTLEQVAGMNAQSIAKMANQSQEEVVRAIRDGHEASAAFVETMDEAALGQTVKLGGYEMPLAEIIAQVWIHHTIAHTYEASARWPIQ
ncbi:MAG: maleylpyruvate isomerase N-terminal domain-containing protein [Thermoflexaceae bacterium]|nr:maleylpyruvate isomerase N-terminal domain-containing protein [Thermoflexaceae bacterium]